jgi:hypothetical protein
MIFRRASYPQETFTTIPNALLRGNNKASERRSDLLSAESVGVLVYLLSHRADWKVTNKQLSGHFKMSPNKVTKVSKELEKAGYLKRHITRNLEGQLLGWDWEVYDTPNQIAGNPDLKNPHLAKPHVVIEELSIKIEKEILLKKKASVFDIKPSGVSTAAWTQWWDYKIKRSRGKQPAASTVTRQTKDFEIFVKAKFDIDEVVSFAISRQWHTIGDPSWQTLHKFQNISRKDDLLGAVK